MNEVPTAPSPLHRQVVLAPGQTAAIEGAGIQIRFNGVDGDTRCPADAFCVLGGDAIVQISVTGDGTAEYDLHTGNVQPVEHRDLTIALVELAPYPFSARPVEPSEYRATLRITR